MGPLQAPLRRRPGPRLPALLREPCISQRHAAASFFCAHPSFLCLWIFTVVALSTQNLTTCTDGTVSLDTWPCCLGAAWAPVVLRAEQVSSAESSLDVRCLCACVCVHTRVFKGAAEIHGEFGAETLLSSVLRYNWYTKPAHIQGTRFVASGHLYTPVSPSARSRSWTPASPGGSSRLFLWGEHLAGRRQHR